MTPALTKRQREVLEAMADGAQIVMRFDYEVLQHAGGAKVSIKRATWRPLADAQLIQLNRHKDSYRITEAGRRAREGKD